MDIKRAKGLLAAATLTRKCGHASAEDGVAWVLKKLQCGACEEYWPVALPAKRILRQLGFTPAAFSVLILAVEALSCDRVVMSPCRKVRPEVETWCAACKALAAWEKL